MDMIFHSATNVAIFKYFISDLIESKNHGIFHLLDEESKLPKPEFGHFTHSVHKELGVNNNRYCFKIFKCNRHAL